MKYLSLSFLVLIGFNLVIWQGVFERVSPHPLEVYFLDVGQGDSQLIVFPDGVKMLIDGGPDKEVLFELEEVLPSTDRYLDMIFMTHPQLDHYGGLRDIVDRYQIGAFVFSGREGEGEAWEIFRDLLIEAEVPVVLVGQGDRVVHAEAILDVLWPDKEFLGHREVNESSLVMELQSEGIEVLLTGDIGPPTEEKLLEIYDMDTDVLKVAHHGSRFSTSLDFLGEATPALSVVQVGSNSFGHPTEATLQRLSKAGSRVYRTDKDGRVKLMLEDRRIGVVLE
ncbi:MAG: MBL fold metallo-hydrolase [bacterium]|nr:MBL fold metallo-hydrolase [bacterium]MDZ4231423.1 MBL fold metallo-hydrolase [Patescibacteria group bacterium]